MATAKPAPLVFPVWKDASTNQVYYTTSLQIGTPPSSMNAVLDLMGRFTWLDCTSYKSSSYRPIPCHSSRCGPNDGGPCTSCSNPPTLSCTNGVCSVFVLAPYVEEMTSSGLGEDVLVLPSTNGIKHTSRSKFRQFRFSCVESYWTKGIPNSTEGVVGLATNPSTLFTGLSTHLNLPRILALCLPSSSSESRHGDLYFGGGPYMRPPIRQDLAKSLLRTQLLINSWSIADVSTYGDEYFIDVTAVKIDSAPITFNSSILVIDKDGHGGTKIATLTPYTGLQSAIFKPLVKEFTKKATDRKIKKAAPVAPFRACFDAKTVKSGVAGPNVPAIVLVLQGDVQWRIEGANSMVRVSEDVMCLGFLDVGPEPRTAIEIGGHQLEDNLVEFDVGSLKFGFSNSLLLQNCSCSHV
ncbi:probable aspartic proteinase GIP2 [Syzygium oleosum]|uniref:probable aspartic proteinase GIP2 n=1 Tax=Syzygium oleosum TaxID=219896 RepID=UPI0024B92430|nr:probable aspartic proteinase GIP2 [Syzygium oleosum]